MGFRLHHPQLGGQGGAGVGDRDGGIGEVPWGDEGGGIDGGGVAEPVVDGGASKGVGGGGGGGEGGGEGREEGLVGLGGGVALEVVVVHLVGHGDSNGGVGQNNKGLAFRSIPDIRCGTSIFSLFWGVMSILTLVLGCLC